MCTIERNRESKLEQELLTAARRDNGVKMDVVVKQLLFKNIAGYNTSN